MTHSQQRYNFCLERELSKDANVYIILTLQNNHSYLNTIKRFSVYAYLLMISYLNLNAIYIFTHYLIHIFSYLNISSQLFSYYDWILSSKTCGEMNIHIYEWSYVIDVSFVQETSICINQNTKEIRTFKYRDSFFLVVTSDTHLNIIVL